LPVVVTGADTRLGRLVVDRLTGHGLDLRATVTDREAVRPLVDRGVKTALSDLYDTERLGAVLEDAHTVVHLHGADTGSGAVLDAVPDVLAAAEDSGVRRIVTMAALAPVHDDHPSLAALLGSAYDVVVFRIGVLLVPLADAGAEPPRVTPVSRRVAPLWVDDLLDAIVAADRLRDLHGHLLVDAVGPDVITGRELDRLLGVTTSWRRRLARGEGADLVGDGGERLRTTLGVTARPLVEAVRLARNGR
jgi:uncharacterized protein YbjT (DUF2867 family)